MTTPSKNARPVNLSAVSAARQAFRKALESLELRQHMDANDVQALPFRLDFNSSVAGTVLDKDNEGVGLTRVQANSLGDQYQPSLIDLDTTAGVLRLTTFGSTTRGSNTAADNSLVNALETQFDARSTGWTINARLVGPLSNVADAVEQVGIYFGPDQDNFVKLAIGADSSGSFLRFEDETSNGTGGYSSTRNGPAATTNIGSFASINTLDLRIEGDATTGTLSAYYRVNADAGSFTRVNYDITLADAKRSSFFNAASRAGLFAFHKNAGAPITATFDSFAINAGGVPLGGDFANAGTVLVAAKDALYFSDTIAAGTSFTQVVQFRNNGTTSLTLNPGAFTISGTNAAQFALASSAPALPITLAPGDTINVPIVFTADAVGLRTATLTATATDGSVDTVALRGLGTAGEGGNLEPSLQRLMDLFQIPVNVGDSTPDTTDIPATAVAGSDEVILNRLVRANSSLPVTIDVLAAFNGAGTVPGLTAAEDPNLTSLNFGFYEPGQLEKRTNLINLRNLYKQTVSPVFTGSTSFTPTGAFGLFSELYNFRETKPLFAPNDPNFQARIAASETYFNNWESTSSRRQKVRFFPLKNSDGTTVPNAYVVTFEDWTVNFDANDFIAIVRNVQSAPSGPEIGLYNLDGMPGYDRLVFNRLQNLDTVYPNTVHDTVTLRIRNTGNSVLQITSAGLSNTDFEFVNSITTPISIAANSSYDLPIKFVYSRTTGTGNEIRTATLTLTTNDADEPTKTATLAGIWQSHSEGGPDGISDEPRLQTIINALGYSVTTGVPTSGTPTDGVPRLGQEVASAYWLAADPAKPVEVRLVAAYHQQKPTTNSNIWWHVEGSTSTSYLFQHYAPDGQSLFPRDKNYTGTGNLPARKAFNPGLNSFGFRVDAVWSDQAINQAQDSTIFPHPDSRWGMRFYLAKDANGNVIPDTYILAQDYIGQSYTNFDYQDNIYLVTNVRPKSGPTAPASPTIASSGSGPRVSWAANREGNLAGYNVYRSTSSNGTFTKVNSSTITATSYTDGSALLGQTYYYFVRAVDIHGTEGGSTAQLIGTRGTDTVPPAPPTGISTSSNTSGITLNWAANSESDLAGYNVYSSLTLNGTYTRLNNTVLTTRTFADTNAASGVVTYYRITAIDVAGNESTPASTSATRPATVNVPAAPTGLATGTVTQTSVALTWVDNATNETGYVVERKTGSGSYATLTTLGANATSFNDVTAAANTTYSYRVRATNSGGSSSYSNEVTVTTPVAIPTAPSGLAATALGSTSVRLTWTDNAVSETGFRIQRRIGAGSWTDLDTAAANTTLYVDGSAQPNTDYSYRVLATNSAGDSAWSNEASVTTPAGVPDAPTTLGAVADATPRVVLTWTDNATDETGYRVERQLGTGGAWSVVANLGANAVTYTDATVAYSTAYNYRVFATGSAGDSAASNTASATVPSGVPATPTGFATTLQGTSVRVTWTDVATNETGYVVERRTGSGSYAVIATLAAGSVGYTDSSVASSTTYTYRVKATGSVGDSTYSTESTITTPAPSSYVSTVIGGPTPAGATVVVNNGVDYNVSAAGTDIYNSSDSFRFVSRSVTGDFDMTVRVDSLTYVNDFTQAGLMARDGLNANARNFMVKYRARGDARVTYRSTTGGATTGAGTATVKVPNAYLRLQRTGDTFIGYASTNGTTWTEVARTTMSLPSTLQIGLAVSSRQQGTATTAQFRSLNVSQTVAARTSGSVVPGTLLDSTTPPRGGSIAGDVLK